MTGRPAPRVRVPDDAALHSDSGAVSWDRSIYGEAMPKILIIDDDERLANAAARTFRLRGYEAVVTTTPFGFTKMINEQEPDLVLVDVKMPALSGDSLVRVVRNAERRHGCLLVFWSSKHPEQLKELVRRSGADGFISKSEEPDGLERKVRELLDAVAPQS